MWSKDLIYALIHVKPSVLTFDDVQTFPLKGVVKEGRINRWMSSCLIDYEIRVCALRRSGHHGIISWIAHHFSSQAHFLNNCPMYKDPWIAHGSCHPLQHTVDAIPLRDENKECLIIGFEEFDVRKLQREPLFIPSGTAGTSSHVLNVLILRDPFNYYASRFKACPKAQWQVSLDDAREIWKGYAYEFLGRTNFLYPKILINYNKWFSSVEYRRSISKEMGLSFTDAGLNYYGMFGSSFDGTKMDGKTQEMDVLNRWKHFVNHPRYRELVNDKELRDISDKLFGPIVDF